SRTRHTSFSRDWSSDVCSSDLVRNRTTERPIDRWFGFEHIEAGAADVTVLDGALQRRGVDQLAACRVDQANSGFAARQPVVVERSEERRVGEGSGWRGGECD